MTKQAIPALCILFVLTFFAGGRVAATDYTWSDNGRLTELHPELQFLTLQPGDHMWIGTGSNPGSKWFANSVEWTNYGTISWTDANALLLTDNGSSLTNSGLIDLGNPGQFWVYPGTGGGWNTLSNTAVGTIRKSAGMEDLTFAYSGTFVDETRFINAGTLDCRAGAMVYKTPMTYFQDGTRFTGPGAHRIAVTYMTEFNGSITVDPGTTLELDNRLWNPSEWGRFNGTPATLHGRARLMVGDLWGAWTLAADGVLTTTPGLAARVDGTFNNHGTVELDGSLYSNATTTNFGVVDFRADNIRFGRSDSNWPTVTNAGLIKKSAGTGRSILGTDGQPDLSLTNAPGGLIDAQQGTLSIFAGNFSVNDGALHAAIDARLDVQTYWPNPFVNQGSVGGAGTIGVLGLLPLVNRGLVQPGDSIGALTIDGAFTQETGGELTIELTGAEEGEFDRVDITGAAVLGGRLRVRAAPGYIPADASTFVVLSAASRQQEFAETTFELPAGCTGEVLYAPTSVTVVLHNPSTGVDGSLDPEADATRTQPRLRTRGTSSAPVLVLELPAAADVHIALFDLAGRQVAEVASANLGAGRHEWTPEGMSNLGGRLQSGIYLARAQVRGTSHSTVLHAKLLVLR